ncbi:MAG: amidohydrolase family protein [Myxococcota bacterium]|nr:amidohydrolase family protein [Myxococcota bacterium]
MSTFVRIILGCTLLIWMPTLQGCDGTESQGLSQSIVDSGHDATRLDAADGDDVRSQPDGLTDASMGTDGLFFVDAGSDAEACGPGDEPESCEGHLFAECRGRDGSNEATLIVGTVLTHDRVLCDGEVLVDGSTGKILCVADDCSDHPLAAEAAIVCGSIVTPGLIDPHNHMSFNSLPRWRHGARLFQNRNEWRSLIGRELYGARPSTGDPVAARYNEVRLLMAATTSVHKAENVRSSHDHVRNIDRGPNSNGLGYGDSAVTECVFPLTQGCSAAPNYDTGESIPERRYIAHLSEGIDASSLAEFERFYESGQLGDKTSIIHCVSCTGTEFSALRAKQASLIWSPQSNVELYGATTDVPSAMNMGINVALGPDWTPSGTMNQLAEMKCAKRLSDTYYDGRISNRDIFRMVTDRAAKSIGVEDLVGRLQQGLYADVAVFEGNREFPYDALVGSSAENVRAVFISGLINYGDSDVFGSFNRRNAFCEQLDICGMDKTICIRDADGDANLTDPDDWPLFGFDDLHSYMNRVVQRRRPDDLPQWLEYVYEPYPVYECEPTFSCEFGNTMVSGRTKDGDRDGDDVDDDEDNCPDVFNPEQGDLDSDGTGNACDPCPWAFDECPCTPPSGIDLDADGIRENEDNCPQHSNPQQTDRDQDGRGDECDFCPDLADGPERGCEASIPEVKRRELNQEQFFEFEGVVTAVFQENAPITQPGSFFMQAAQTEENPVEDGHRGVYVYMGNRAQGVSIPSVGDAVQVTGKTSDYYGQAQLNQITRISTTLAEFTPRPVTPPFERLIGQAERYEGMLVCINEIVVTDIEPDVGPGDNRDQPINEFVVTDVISGLSIRINDVLYLSTPFPELGDGFQQICGVHRLANGHYKIEPRDSSDLDQGPPIVMGFEPNRGYTRAGLNRSPRAIAGQPIQISLSRPAGPDGQFVQLQSSEPDHVSVPPEIFIPAGELYAELPTRAHREHIGVTVTARTPTQEGSGSALIAVYGERADAEFIEFERDFYGVILNEVIQIRVIFDKPLLRQESLEIRAETPGLVRHAETVMIESNAHSGVFELVGARVGETMISVNLGPLVARVSVFVTPRPSRPLINEVNVDMAGAEFREYVEIYNPGPIPLSLDTISLEFINGNNGEPYERFDLGEVHPELPGFRYLIVGDQALEESLPAETLFIPIESRQTEHDIQNGPDGFLLLDGDVIIDSMSYAGEIEGVTEGDLSAPDDPNDDLGESISRCPNGADTDNNGDDFNLVRETPGADNLCNPPIDPDAGINDSGFVPDNGLGNSDAGSMELDSGRIQDAGLGISDASPFDNGPPRIDGEQPRDGSVNDSEPLDIAAAETDGELPDSAPRDSSDVDRLVFTDASADVNDAQADSQAGDSSTAISDGAISDGAISDTGTDSPPNTNDAGSPDAISDGAIRQADGAPGDAGRENPEAQDDAASPSDAQQAQDDVDNSVNGDD